LSTGRLPTRCWRIFPIASSVGVSGATVTTSVDMTSRTGIGPLASSALRSATSAISVLWETSPIRRCSESSTGT